MSRSRRNTTRHPWTRLSRCEGISVQSYSLPRFTLFDSASSTRLVTPCPCLRIHGTEPHKFFGPGCVGCLTLVKPVPSQAGHLVSATASFGQRFIIRAPKKSNTTTGRIRTPTCRPFRAVFSFSTRRLFLMLGQKLLAFPELKAAKGIHLSRRHIDRMEANGDFPVRVKVGERHVAWVESEIDAHVSELMNKRPARKARPTRH